MKINHLAGFLPASSVVCQSQAPVKILLYCTNMYRALFPYQEPGKKNYRSKLRVDEYTCEEIQGMKARQVRQYYIFLVDKPVG